MNKLFLIMFNGFTLDLKLLLEDIYSSSWFFSFFSLYDFAVFFNYFRRIFKNIFSHAEQITQVYFKFTLSSALPIFFLKFF